MEGIHCYTTGDSDRGNVLVVLVVLAEVMVEMVMIQWWQW